MYTQDQVPRLGGHELERLLEAPTGYNCDTVDTQRLLEDLLPEVVKQRKWMEICQLLAVAVLSLCVLAALGFIGWVARLLWGSAGGVFLLPMPLFLLGALVYLVGKELPVSTFFAPRRLSELLTLASHQFRAQPRIAALPTLLSVLHAAGDPPHDSAAGRALFQLRDTTIRLLPSLNTADALTLDATQCAYLRSMWLQPGSNPRGQVAALLVLASARDCEALPLAHALLERTTNEAVREAARELLNACGG